jgi:hypothetical protein
MATDGLIEMNSDEQPIAEVLRDMPLKAGDHLGAGLLIGPHYLAQVFGVETRREGGRVNEITDKNCRLRAR